jgi:hypothetical protein
MLPNAVDRRFPFAVPFQPDADNAAVLPDLLVADMLVTNPEGRNNGWLCFYV